MATYFAKIVTFRKNINPFAFEWIIYRHSDQKLLQSLSVIPSGCKTLDVGCGSAVYWDLRSDLVWTGIDINPDSNATIVIKPDEPWPFKKEFFDSVILSFSIEHISNLNFLITEITRVLKPGGTLVIRCPFLYPLHDTPDDFWRFSLEGLNSLFSKFEIVESNYVGNFFAATAVNRNYYLLQTYERIFSKGAKKLFRVFCFPAFLLVIFTGNLVAFIFSKLDRTDKFPILVNVSYRKI